LAVRQPCPGRCASRQRLGHLLILPNDAPDADLDPAAAWRIGRDAGLIADVVADREEDVLAAVDIVNTLAFVVQREGIRLA
jgi:hypothetical protein